MTGTARSTGGGATAIRRRARSSASYVKVVRLHVLRESRLASESEPSEFDSTEAAGAVAGPEPSETADSPPPPRRPPPVIQRPAQPKTWRWVRPPSPAALIARSLEPRDRGSPARRSARPVDPVQVIARALDSGSRRTPSEPAGEATARPHEASPEAAAVAAEAEQVETRSEEAAPDAEAAFWQIWLAHRDYLRQQSLRLSSGNVADAEDALSEAMLRAAQAFPKSIIRNHRAWLLRLVHNACMDRYRSNHRHKQLAQVITEEAVQAVPAIAARRDRTPEDLLSALEQIHDLQRAMSALPPMLAEPLMLYLNDLSDGEIAGNLRVTKEVVRKRRQIARAWLRRHTSF